MVNNFPEKKLRAGCVMIGPCDYSEKFMHRDPGCDGPATNCQVRFSIVAGNVT